MPKTVNMEGESGHQRPNKLRKPTNPTSRNCPYFPDSLLEQFASKLSSRNDIRCFRRICRRCSLLVAAPCRNLFRLPQLKIPSPVGPVFTGGGSHFKLVETTIYSFEPYTGIVKPWLLKVQEFDKNPKVRIKNILSKQTFRNLSNDELPHPLNLVRFRTKEIGKSYELDRVVPNRAQHLVDYGKLVNYFLQKVIVTSFLDLAEVGFAVMVLHDAGLVHVWREGDGSWTNIRIPNERSSFEDIVYHDKKFYVVDIVGHTITVDPRILAIEKVAGPVPYLGTAGSKYLVSSCHELFLVDKYWIIDNPAVYLRKYVDGDIYPLRVSPYIFNKENYQWVRVTCELKDRVVFVGEDCSFSLSTEVYPGCRGNSVCVIDHAFAGEARNQPGWNIGVFDLNNGTCQPISASRDYQNLIWPPPTWLKSNNDDSLAP